MDAEKSSNSSFEDLAGLNESNGSSGDADGAPTETSGVEEIRQRRSSLNVKVDDDQKEKNDEDENDENEVDLLQNGQIIKRIIKKGNPDTQPQTRDFVKINYTGKLENGVVVEEEKNYEIQVGDFEVVQGLDMIIPLMNVGEVAEVELHSRFAYGSIGLKNEINSEKSIPPHSKITYVVEILECQAEDEESLNTFVDRKRLGNRKRERANYWYNRNEFNIAIQLYRRALEYLDDTDVGIEESKLTNKELQELLEDRLVVFNNLAMSQIKISAFDTALTSVETVLRCQPNNSKALFRKGRILDAKGDTKGAIALLQRAATLEPDSKSIQQDLAKLILKNRREERNEKEMYQKMLGQARKLEQTNKVETQPKRAEMTRMRLLGYLMGSILVGVAGVAIYRYKY